MYLEDDRRTVKFSFASSDFLMGLKREVFILIALMAVVWYGSVLNGVLLVVAIS